MKNQKGFTLIELAIVITILGILAIVIIPRYQDLTREARTAANQGVLGGVKSSVYIYYAKHLGKFPGVALGGANADSILTEMPTGWVYDAAWGTADSGAFLHASTGDTIVYGVSADSSTSKFRTGGTYW